MCSMSEIRISRSAPAYATHPGRVAGSVAVVVGRDDGLEPGRESPGPDLTRFDRSVTDVGLDKASTLSISFFSFISSRNLVGLSLLGDGIEILSSRTLRICSETLRSLPVLEDPCN